MIKYKQQLFFVVLLCLVLLFFESIIKYYYILNKIPETGFYLLGNFLQINYTMNFNLAFGLPVPQGVTIFIVLILLIFLSLLWTWHFLLREINKLLGLSLVIVGALSNLMDRLIVGHVIDYLNIWIWPVFNLADIMIVVGVIIYLIFNYKK